MASRASPGRGCRPSRRHCLASAAATAWRSAPGLLGDFLPNALGRPLTMALTATLALTADLAGAAELLVACGVPVLFFWGDKDRLIVPGALGAIAGALPAEVVEGRHGWLLS